MKSKLTKDLLEFYNKRLKPNNSISEKLIFIGSLLTTLFLLFTYLNYKIFHLNNVILGFFHELLIIPCVFSQPVFLFLSTRKFFRIKLKVKSYAFYTIVISLITFILTWGSLLMAKI